VVKCDFFFIFFRFALSVAAIFPLRTQQLRRYLRRYGGWIFGAYLLMIEKEKKQKYEKYLQNKKGMKIFFIK